MKRQSWNALTQLSRHLQLGFVLCGGVIVACGDDASDSGGETDAGDNGAGKGGTGGKAGGGGGTGGIGSDLDAGPGDEDGGSGGAFSFFVTSDTSVTGNLGGLSGADKRCQDLAAAAGGGSSTWHAYLSLENNGSPVNARDRIGAGPWYNVKGALIAKDLTALHARNGDASLFLDEKGNKINGQWVGSPSPNQHDVFTGSNPDGTVLANRTCKDWTSETASDLGQVGHTDGLGPNQNSAPPYNSWNSVHENGGCNDTAPRGGAGKLYCFAID